MEYWQCVWDIYVLIHHKSLSFVPMWKTPEPELNLCLFHLISFTPGNIHLLWLREVGTEEKGRIHVRVQIPGRSRALRFAAPPLVGNPLQSSLFKPLFGRGSAKRVIVKWLSNSDSSKKADYAWNPFFSSPGVGPGSGPTNLWLCYSMSCVQYVNEDETKGRNTTMSWSVPIPDVFYLSWHNFTRIWRWQTTTKKKW